MVRADFEAIWKADKSIIQDVVFGPSLKGDGNVYSVDDIEVLGVGFVGLSVNMSYECEFGGLTCNFTLKGTGAIHRYCLGATAHGEAGRFHQHQITHGDCVRRQLPKVVSRLDMIGLSTREMWLKMCSEANIAFTGTFFEPELRCK